MTESDWLSSIDPSAMLSFLRDKGPFSSRKYGLFALACCRRLWHLLTDERSRLMVEVAERAVDGFAGEEDTDAVRQAVADAATARRAPDEDPASTQMYVHAARAVAVAGSPRGANVVSALAVVAACSRATQYPLSELDLGVEHTVYCDILRDIFGNPFSPPLFTSGWRTEAVVSLARGVYEKKAFDRMSVLADALEDAGCDDEGVLEHCRGPNAHIRGCWVVDEVLGKS